MWLGSTAKCHYQAPLSAHTVRTMCWYIVAISHTGSSNANGNIIS